MWTIGTYSVPHKRNIEVSTDQVYAVLHPSTSFPLISMTAETLYERSSGLIQRLDSLLVVLQLVVTYLASSEHWHKTRS
jgi:hypothetical protein